MKTLAEKADAVRSLLLDQAPVLIAYSGGVDSSTLLWIAAHTPGLETAGIIADSPSLPRAELRKALDQANRMGVSVRLVATREMEDPRYVSNPPNRCYFCKAELFQHMERIAREENYRSLAYGENADDPPALRPGSLAAREFQVLAPLRTVGLRKHEVRALAREFGLDSADSPAQPCLSSRIPHGTPVTAQALQMIESAEAFLKSEGFRVVRVRHRVENGEAHAVVQVAPAEVSALQSQSASISDFLQRLGYASSSIDRDGYRGASLEAILSEASPPYP